MRADERMFIEILKDFSFDSLNYSLSIHPRSERLNLAQKGKIKACFITDVYDLKGIQDVSSNFHCFITTSELQARVLKSVLGIPAFWIYEPVDPFYKFFKLNPKGEVFKEIVIFGYSNSIERMISPFMEDMLQNLTNFTFRVFSERVPKLPHHWSSKIVWDKFENISNLNDGNYRYFIITDVAADLSLATMAKSLNKLISGICMNLIPVVITYNDKFSHFDWSNYRLIGGREILDENNFIISIENYLRLRSKILSDYMNLYQQRKQEVVTDLINFGGTNPDYIINSKMDLIFTYSIKHEFLRFTQALVNRFS
jgi:hypothetical protein